MTPEENRPADEDQQPRTRRTVRLPGPDNSQQPTTPPARGVPDPARGTMKDRWLRVAELVVGDWAPTLREAAFRVILFTLVLIVVGIAFGAGVAVLGALVGFLMFLLGRRRAGSAG